LIYDILVVFFNNVIEPFPGIDSVGDDREIKEDYLGFLLMLLNRFVILSGN
jgi:hypothetical protein